jgi:murein DD-endopeptidase MepM/ murein hydrolase activator NlpD
VIGEVGMSGMATGAHLHFEVQVDGRAIDPVVWLAS